MSENLAYDKSLQFALSIIELYGILIKNHEYTLSKQLLRSGTSIGANISEAIAAHSKKEFHCKINIALKEARESKYWLILLTKSKAVVLNYEQYLADIEVVIRILAKTSITTKSKLEADKSKQEAGS